MEIGCWARRLGLVLLLQLFDGETVISFRVHTGQEGKEQASCMQMHINIRRVGVVDYASQSYWAIAMNIGRSLRFQYTHQSQAVLLINLLAIPTM